MLAIDGRGVKGIIPAILLNAIEKAAGKPARELFDVITGISTGSFIAALATCQGKTTTPFSAEEIVSIYKKDAHRYFARRSKGWFRPKYRGRAVIEVLREHFGDAELKDAATRIIIPFYELREDVPRVHYFSSLAADNKADDNFHLWQVVRGATSAPAFFPAYEVESVNGAVNHWVIDGGVYANNPALLGWLHAYHSFNPDSSSRELSERFYIDPNIHPEISDTVIVSLGTGRSRNFVKPGKAKKWGVFHWAPHILDVVMEGQSDLVNDQIETLEDIKMVSGFRLQPDLPRPIEVGEAAEIPMLEKLAEDFLHKNAAEISNICKALTESQT